VIIFGLFTNLSIKLLAVPLREITNGDWYVGSYETSFRSLRPVCFNLKVLIK